MNELKRLVDVLRRRHKELNKKRKMQKLAAQAAKAVIVRLAEMTLE